MTEQQQAAPRTLQEISRFSIGDAFLKDSEKRSNSKGARRRANKQARKLARSPTPPCDFDFDDETVVLHEI